MRRLVGYLCCVALFFSTVSFGGDPFLFPGRNVLWLGVFRHGIRSPEDPEPSLGRPVTIYNFSDKPFPPWPDSTKSHPAGKGGLTPHGAKVLANWGKWFQVQINDHYKLNLDDCSNAYYMGYSYTDVSHRCQDSSRAFWSGLAPGCQVRNTTVPATSAGKNVYPGTTLFKHYTNDFDLPFCTGNSNETLGGGNITRRQEWFMNEFEAEIKLIDEILGPITPGICNKTEGPCSLFDVPYEAPVWDDSQVFRGPFGYANYWANYFLSQYFENQTVAFGLLPETGFSAVLKLARIRYASNIFFTITGAAAYSYGTELFSHIISSLDQAAMKTNLSIDSIDHPAQIQFLTYFGHHENLAFIVKMLDVQFLSHYNDLLWNPFSSAIFLRLYLDTDIETGNEDLFVGAYFMTPEPEQQRNLNSFDFDNPSIERLQMPWCTSPSGFYCKYSDFRNYVFSRVIRNCMYDSTLSDYVFSQRDQLCGTLKF